VPRPPRADVDASLCGALGESVGSALVARMIAMFCPPLSTEEVRHQLAAAAMSFDEARVRNFLEVLIERAAVSRLRRIVDGVEGVDGVDGVDSDATPPPLSFRLYLIDKEAS